MRRLSPAARVNNLVMHHPSPGSGRVAVVTGGSRGVGREVVRKLAGRGYAVAVGYVHDQGAATAVVDEVIATGGNALMIRADVADELDVERLFTETIAAFGGVDVVVHAATLVAREAVAHDLDSFDAVHRTNVRGTFVVDREAARHLGGGGAIVNVSSSSTGPAAPVDASHAAGRGAVEAITRVFARDLRQRDITVNAVAAGAKGLDVAAVTADLVALLVSGEGRSLNGQVIRVDAQAN